MTQFWLSQCRGCCNWVVGIHSEGDRGSRQPERGQPERGGSQREGGSQAIRDGQADRNREAEAGRID